MNKDNFINWVKVHIKLIIFLFIIIYIMIPLSPFIVSPIGIFSKDDATLFINYYGAIVSGITGGALTLGGVWWSNNEQKKELMAQQIKFEQQRREDLAMQYRPILNCTVQGHSVVDNTLIVILTLTNTGRAEAVDINIESSSNMSIKPQISSNKTHMLEMNHNFSFTITLEHIKQKINDNCYETSPISTIFDAKNIFPQVLIKITYTDIVQTSYCLEFEMLCQYVRQGSFDESENLVSHEIFEKLESTPKSWLIDLTNLQVKKLN